MARRTKQEAEATRHALLDAAERVFHAKGVSRTTLHDIAQAAGVTRGALYWHFEDKDDVVAAMLQRVVLPMEDAATALPRDATAPVLPVLRTQAADLLRRVATDERTRRVFEIVSLRFEYTDEFAAAVERRRQMRRDYRRGLERTLRLAQRRGELPARPAARTMAIGLHALLSGLIQHWMLEPQGFDLVRVGCEALDRHLAGLAGPTAAAARGSPGGDDPVPPAG